MKTLSMLVIVLSSHLIIQLVSYKLHATRCKKIFKTNMEHFKSDNHGEEKVKNELMIDKIKDAHWNGSDEMSKVVE